MQTTVEQLLNTLKCRLDVINKETTELREQMLQDLLVDTEKYLEMEKQQKIDFANKCIHKWKFGDVELGKNFAEQLYNETYGSKGSDETPMLIRLKEHLSSITTEQFNNEIDEINKEMGYEIKKNITLSYLLDKYIEISGYGMDMWSKEENSVMSIVAEIIQNYNQLQSTSSQTEISDEEIDRRFNEKKLEQLILLLESRSKELENEFNSKNDIEGLTTEQSRYAKIKKIGESEGINLCVLQIKNLLKLK